MSQLQPTQGRPWFGPTIACVALTALAIGTSSAQDTSSKSVSKPFDEHVRPFLVRHCQECHGGEKPKGDFRVDRLTPDFDEPASRDRWATVLKRVWAGEM